MTKSILSNERECYICGRTTNLAKHHIFMGTSKRKKSDKTGCWVYLCDYHHNMSPYSVHGLHGHLLDKYLKQNAQRRFEVTHSRAEFMDIFGRNYLDD